MNIINIKPLSVNEAWKGKRYKTQKYKDYEINMFFLLPKKIQLFPKMKLSIFVGFSSSLSDNDNPIKPFTDILQKKYNFNDKDIYNTEIEKEIVPKGKEYIAFEISEYKQNEFFAKKLINTNLAEKNANNRT